MNQDPLFVIGYKRSGTTMLRLMLNNHSSLAIPPESEYFRQVPRRLGHGLQRREDLDRISRELAALRACDFGQGLKEKDYRDLLGSFLPCRTPELLAAFYRHWAGIMGKPEARWGDKKPQHWQFVYRLKEWYPDSQYIHIVRDPRDVIASIEQHFPDQVIGRQWLPFHLISAWQWRLSNLAMEKQGASLGKHRYLRMRYEQLVADPQASLQRIARFLDVPYEAQMLQFQDAAKDPRVQRSTTGEGEHVNTTREINLQRIGRAKESLTESQTADIEFLCRDSFCQEGWERRGGKVSAGRAAYLLGCNALLNVVWRLRRTWFRLGGGL